VSYEINYSSAENAMRLFGYDEVVTFSGGLLGASVDGTPFRVCLVCALMEPLLPNFVKNPPEHQLAS
jgi:hypothetical protein